MTKIVACSVDYDNCGDNIFYKEESPGMFVSQYNPHTDNALYKTLLTLYSGGSHRYLYVGSARQSWGTDFCDSCMNSNGTHFASTRQHVKLMTMRQPQG